MRADAFDVARRGAPYSMANGKPIGLRPRVLLVDDHKEILVAVAQLLTTTCDVVGEVADGSLVIETAVRVRPDIIVLDVNLPGRNGLDLCQELVGISPPVRVVILTALTAPEIEREAYRRGAFACVSKWQMADQLVQVIQRAWDDAPPIHSS